MKKALKHTASVPLYLLVLFAAIMWGIFELLFFLDRNEEPQEFK